jgi:uncharacterized protein with FMN-binding domain
MASIPPVVAAQSLQVDVVTGAAGSSKCILKEIEIAFESAARYASWFPFALHCR